MRRYCYFFSFFYRFLLFSQLYLATVPEGIVAFLGIQEGDKLQWKMDLQNNERVAVVNKKSNQKDSVELARYSIKEKRKRTEI